MGGGGGVDWRSLSSSSESISSAFLSEGFPSSSFSQMLNGSDAIGASTAHINDGKAQESKANIEFSGDAKPKPVKNWLSIAERRAATCGFSAPRINTARFKRISPSSSPMSRSPYLTIPAGLSPTSLLDSPVMLPNTQALPSPTTGTFSLPLSDENPMSVPLAPGIDKEKCDEVNSSFKFMSNLNAGGLSYLLGSGNQVAPSSNQPHILEVTDVNHQTLAHMQPNRDLECQNDLLKPTVAKRSTTDSPDIEISNSMTTNSKCVAIQKGISNVSSDQVPLQEEPFDGDDTGSQKILEGEQRGSYPYVAMGKPSEDGYNWRKYGQKQVKGSEFPRSYYKCTHPNCQVKKKVERSLDGQITEIIYKGGHNHQKPQPSRRSAVGSICSMNDFSEVAEGRGPCVKVEGGSTWKSTTQGSKDNKVGFEWMADGLERTSSTSVLTELSDQLSNVPGKQLTVMESADTPELSSTLANHDDDDDDVATQGSMSVGDGADDEESESKRRKKESCLIETTMASRAIREPRIVVQTDSEIDILDDGYRWRKYGQKVVKGNPNPRSYYKCTSAGCPVRKHVERASHDLKSVITTYEGKHNHEVPTARNSSHASSSSGNVSHAGPIAQTTLTLSRSTSFPKTELQLQELAPYFERKPEFASEFMRPGYLGSFHSDIKLGLPYFELKLPSLQAIPYGSFGMNTEQNEANPVASIPQVVPEFPIPMPMNMPQPGNLPFTSFDLSNHGRPLGPAQSYLGMQQHKETDTRFLRPKEEQKDDAVYDTRLPMSHLPNASSSVYSQMMGGFPL